MFIDVFALPNASRIGFDARILASSPTFSAPELPAVAANARYWSTFLAVSDLPAPLSPLITSDCDRPASSPRNDAADVPFRSVPIELEVEHDEVDFDAQMRRSERRGRLRRRGGRQIELLELEGLHEQWMLMRRAIKH